MNLWKEFLDSNPDIAKKLDGMPLADPIVEMVDSALEQWTSERRNVIFEFTPERREMLIRIVKKAIDYDFIDDSPFYQYIRAYVLHLYYWLIEIQEMEVQTGNQRKVDYLKIFEEIISEVFRLGYAMGKIKPKKGASR